MEKEIYRILRKYLYGDNIDRLENNVLIKIKNYITDNKAIEFVLPAFPGKSPNENSSFDGRFGYEENYSINVMRKMLNEIGCIYKYGAKFIIVHDGHLFSDLNITRSDEELSNYIKDFRNAIDDRIVSVSLKDLMNCTNYDDARKKFNEIYVKALDGKSLSGKLIEKEILFTRIEFRNQISKYGDSSSHLQVIAKRIAKQSLLKKKALGMCIEEKYPCAIRLSIHYQDKDSQKLGFKFIDKAINFGSPWFNIIYKCENGEIILGKSNWFVDNRKLVNDPLGCYYCIEKQALVDFKNHRMNEMMKEELSIGR